MTEPFSKMETTQLSIQWLSYTIFEPFEAY